MSFDTRRNQLKLLGAVQNWRRQQAWRTA